MQSTDVLVGANQQGKPNSSSVDCI